MGCFFSLLWSVFLYMLNNMLNLNTTNQVNGKSKAKKGKFTCSGTFTYW